MSVGENIRRIREERNDNSPAGKKGLRLLMPKPLTALEQQVTGWAVYPSSQVL